MTTIKYLEPLRVLRATTRELSKTFSLKGQRRDPAISHMLDLIRENQVTEKRYCRPHDHYKYFADTYLTYLKCLRLQNNITQKYFNKQEKSVEESARLVGLDLPKQYQ